MTSFQAAALSCRLLALYVAYNVLSMTSLFPLTIRASAQENNPLFLATYFVPFLLLAAFAAFLWFRAGWLAARIAAVPGDGAANAPMTGSSLQRVLLVVVGVLVLAFAVPEAARAVAMAVLASEDAAQARSELGKTVAENWSLLLRFVIGFGLVFGAPAISSRLDRLQ